MGGCFFWEKENLFSMKSEPGFNMVASSVSEFQVIPNPVLFPADSFELCSFWNHNDANITLQLLCSFLSRGLKTTQKSNTCV